MATETAVRERPILFSAPMVRAILDGRKTVTRRVVKGAALSRLDDPGVILLSPYGSPGDRLWVRESFYRSTSHGGHRYADEVAPDSALVTKGIPAGTWKRVPSIHMPRTFSRITLEVVSVRVERLQGITEEDAIAEGLSWVAPTYGIPGMAESWHGYPRESFRVPWDSINGRRPGCSWGDDPWVWRIEFRRAP